jgi:uncharacterized protein (DUF58 family)
MTKTRSRVYILPTRYGLLFIVATVLITLIGSAYQNNLVNAVAYFMLSVIFATAIATHNNVKDIDVVAIEAEGGFAGSEVVVTTTLANAAREERYNLESRMRRMITKNVYESRSTLAAKGLVKIQASYPAERRGRHVTRGVRVSSVYPLGLFEAWKVSNVALAYFVYPRLNGSRSLPPAQNSMGDDLGQSRGRGDDFHGHRSYQASDPHRHIDWKAVARGRPRLVKEFNEGAPGIAVFDWQSVAHLPFEERLEQLAVWIDEARERKLHFMLRLPGTELPAGYGLNHARRCWRALAEFPAEGA